MLCESRISEECFERSQFRCFPNITSKLLAWAAIIRKFDWMWKIYFQDSTFRCMLVLMCAISSKIKIEFKIAVKNINLDLCSIASIWETSKKLLEVSFTKKDAQKNSMKCIIQSPFYKKKLKLSILRPENERTSITFQVLFT